VSLARLSAGAAAAAFTGSGVLQQQIHFRSTHMRAMTLAALMLMAGVSVHAGGVVNVRFVEPDRFVDSGNSQFDKPANLKVIEQHLQQLGQRYLADGQTLQIDVTDVDLAGEKRPSRRAGEDVRIVRGKAD
jgi:Protein of unknown function (DUF3016)